MCKAITKSLKFLNVNVNQVCGDFSLESEGSLHTIIATLKLRNIVDNKRIFVIFCNFVNVSVGSLKVVTNSFYCCWVLPECIGI